VGGLRSTGHYVGLLAPAGPGGALLGHGSSDVDSLVSWDGADPAGLLTKDGLRPGALRDLLSSFETAIAYTRSRDLVHGLLNVIPRVLAHDPAPPPGAGHAAAWLTRPLSELGVDVPLGPPPVATATPAEREAAASVLQRLPPGFVAVHPGSGSPAKNWPADRFASLAESLAEGRPWLLVEGPADASAAGSLRHRPTAVPAASLPPRVLGAMLAQAGVYVGNDSGVSHLAAAWGAPTAALFGPTDPEIWSPLGPSVEAIRATDGTMTSITIGEVESVARRIRRRDDVPREAAPRHTRSDDDGPAT
jgi:glycosyl transferase family 9 (putative heptosyltransferase)